LRNESANHKRTDYDISQSIFINHGNILFTIIFSWSASRSNDAKRIGYSLFSNVIVTLFSFYYVFFVPLSGFTNISPLVPPTFAGYEFRFVAHTVLSETFPSLTSNTA
jgi:hypothetical protein